MDTLKICAVQYDIVWENPKANFDIISKLLDNEQLDNIDLIILPEMFNTGFSMTGIPIAEYIDGDSIQFLKHIAGQYNAWVIASLAIVEDGLIYNRLIVASKQKVEFFYDKTHLFSLAGEDQVFRRGKEKLVFDYKGWSICPLVCYDLRFPMWSFNIESIDLYIYIASWPSTRIHHWSTLLTARAIENQSFVIGLNRVGADNNNLIYNGRSAIFSFDGTKIMESEGQSCSMTQILDKKAQSEYKMKFPFIKDAVLPKYLK